MRTGLFALAIVAASSAQLSAVTPVSRSSEVYYFLRSGTDTTAQHSTSSFGDYTHAVSLNGGDASQTTSTSLSGATATLNVTAPVEATSAGTNNGRSSFSYSFDVATATPFTLRGLATTEQASFIPQQSREAAVSVTASLTGPGTTVGFTTSDVSHPFDYAGILQPGSYTFSTNAYASDHSAAVTGGNSHLTATLVVPEPTTLAGLTASAILLGRRRRG